MSNKFVTYWFFLHCLISNVTSSIKITKRSPKEAYLKRCLNHITEVHCIQRETQRENKSLMEQCIIDILQRYFIPFDTVICVDVSFNLDFPVIRINLSKTDIVSQIVILRYSGCIIQISDGEIGSIFEKLNRIRFFQPSAKFIIIINKIEKRLFKTLAKYFIWNVVVIETKSIRIQEMYVYHPYRHENPVNVNLEFELINRCVNGNISNGFNFFKNALPKFWRNATLKVSHTPVEPYTIYEKGSKIPHGLQVTLLNVVKNELKYNLSYSFLYEYVIDYAEGKFSPAFKSLKERTADVLLGNIAVSNKYLYLDFDPTSSYIEDKIIWAAPMARKLPAWKALMYSFTPILWISIILVILILYSSTSVMLWLLKEHNPDLSEIFLDFWLALLALPMLHMSKFHSIKIMLTQLMFFSLLITSIFKSKFTFVLTGDLYEEQIESVEDAVRSGLKLGVKSVALRNLNSSNQVHNNILNHYVSCKYREECLNRTAFEGDMISIYPKRYVEYLTPLIYLDSDGVPLVHKLENYINNVKVKMFFTKGHPIVSSFDTILVKFTEAGLIDKFLKLDETDNLRKMEAGLREKLNANLGSKRLNLETTSFAFMILCTGYVIAGIVCILEILLYRKQRKQKM